VNIDNKLDVETRERAGLTVPFVGPDNREGARLVGAEVAKRLHPGDPVAILEGIPTAFNGQQRRLGFEDAMRAAGATVVSVQSGQWEQALSNTVASAMLREHPGLKAILASNDSMALGAAAAVRQAGRTGEVLVAGFDNISAIRELLRDGRVTATADQHADKLAVYGIEYALQILREKKTPSDRNTPVDLITADSLASGKLVSGPSGSRHNSRAGHPGWRRCSSLKYTPYSRSSRLASRAPRSGTYVTIHWDRTLARGGS